MPHGLESAEAAIMGMGDGGEQFFDGIPSLPPPPIIATHDADIIMNNNDQMTTTTLSRRQKAARGTLAKIDSVYSSVHALEIVSNLLQDACSYLETISNEFSVKHQQQQQQQKQQKENKGCGVDMSVTDLNKSLKLPCDCLHVAIDGLNQHRSIISQAIVNSSDSKEVKYAQKKLMKSQNQNLALQSLNNHSEVMERDPESALTISLKYTQEVLGDILSRTNPDFIEVASRGKNKRKSSVMMEQSSTNSEQAAGGLAKKQKKNTNEGCSESKENVPIEVIDLPSPVEGKSRYSPLETVAYIMNIIENHPGRLYVRAYKEKVVSEKLIPIQMSQLNSLIRQYGGPDKPVASLRWNERGAREIGSDNLSTKFQEKQKQGLSWSIDDTRDALFAAMTTENKNKKEAIAATIEYRHSTLMELHTVQNHINRQIQIQEQRLKESPPTAPVKMKERQPPTKLIRFDKNDKRYLGINLPKPAGGNLMYTPSETVTNIMHFIQGKPTPSRTDVRMFKEKMMAERVIPISISQLNSLLKNHGGPDKEPAPKCWNVRGREEIISIEDLVKKVNNSHIMSWTIKDTCDAVWAEKREKLLLSKEVVPEEVKRPAIKTVNAYHTALLSIPELAGRVVKPEVAKPGPKAKN